VAAAPRGLENGLLAGPCDASVGRLRHRRLGSLRGGRKLPKRFRIVFSLGHIPAAVQESAVGRSPCSSMTLRMAARARSSGNPDFR
jgi:hypothetical protein